MRVNFPTSYPPPEDTRIWYLVDPPAGIELLHGAPFTHRHIFYAAFISPNWTCYQRLLKKGGLLWIMDPWPVSEIMEMYVPPNLVSISH